MTEKEGMRGESAKTRAAITNRCVLGDCDGNRQQEEERCEDLRGGERLGWRVGRGSGQPGRAESPAVGPGSHFQQVTSVLEGETGVRFPVETPRRLTNRGLIKWQPGVSESPSAAPAGEARRFPRPISSASRSIPFP